MPFHRAGKHYPLQVASACDEVLYLVTMRDARNVLLDDWAVVQHLCHVVAGCADKLDAA